MKEVSPVGMLGFADRGGGRQDCRGFWTTQKPETRLVRETIGFEGIDFPFRPHEILERVASAAIAGNDVIEVATIFADVFAGVLADATIAREDSSAADARNAHRHPIVLRGNDDGRYADPKFRRGDDEIEFAHGQLDPLVPSEWVQVERPVEIPGVVPEFRVSDVETHGRRQAGRSAIERDERLLDGAMADDLPRTVERQDDGLFEEVGVHGGNGS